MNFASQPAAKGRVIRPEQMILFRIGSQLFAISASVVQEIRSADSIGSAAADIQQPGLRKVRSLVRRGRRTLYIVHGGTLFGLPPSQAALVFLFRNRRAALLVDAIDRMAAITRLQAVPQSFCHEERNWYRGFVAMENSVIPVVNPDGLLLAQEIAQLDAAAETASAENAAADPIGGENEFPESGIPEDAAREYSAENADGRNPA
ncbi:MAG: chemotaxis protein CheW [Acidobacteriia bacterium]|nr:chemotaxis protein CheW [Terriglobia bacterium]